MEEFRELLEAIAKVATVFGPVWTLTFLAVLVGYHQLREWQKERKERTLADEKEAQIQRLAADNLWMRQVMMKKVMGLSEHEIRHLVGEGSATPLLSAGKAQEREP